MRNCALRLWSPPMVVSWVLAPVLGCGGSTEPPPDDSTPTMVTQDFSGSCVTAADPRRTFTMGSAGTVTVSFRQASNDDAYIVLCNGMSYPCEVGAHLETVSASLPSGTNSFYVTQFSFDVPPCTYTVSVRHPE
jgi:hypothetical protein